MIRYGTTTLTLNTWYFVTGVYDASARTIHVYVNGNLDDGALVGNVTASQKDSLLPRQDRSATGGDRDSASPAASTTSASTTPRIPAAQVQADMTAPLGSGRLDRPAAADGQHHRAGEQRDGAATSSRVDRRRLRQRRRRRRPVPGRRHRRGLGGHAVALRASSGTRASTANGPHTLTARARDAAGNMAISTPVIGERHQHELVPERHPRDRLRPADGNDVPARRPAPDRSSCKGRSRCCRRRTRTPTRPCSSRSPTSGPPACSRASSTSSSTRTSRPTTSITSSTRPDAQPRPPVALHRQRRRSPAPSPGSELVLYQDPATPTPSTTAVPSCSATTARSTSPPATTSTPPTPSR